MNFRCHVCCDGEDTNILFISHQIQFVWPTKSCYRLRAETRLRQNVFLLFDDVNENRYHGGDNNYDDHGDKGSPRLPKLQLFLSPSGDLGIGQV